MKIYKLEIMIIDFDDVGDEITSLIENVRYPNHCLSSTVMDIKSVDIGEWDDDNPLNNNNTNKAEYERLFKKEKK